MKTNEEFEKTITQIKQQIELLLNDTSVPRNVKSALDAAKKSLEGNDDYAMKASSATYRIDEVSNDINLPPYARTVIWNVLSMLETIKE